MKVFRWAMLALLGITLTSSAGEKEVRQAVSKAFSGVPIDSITPASFDANWFEVVVSGEIFYVDASGRYLMAGSIIDLSNRKNITQEKKEQLSRVNVKTLPLAYAIKRVQGNGKRVLITFEDPFCTYCKKLAQELKKVNNVTIYTFLYPVISPNSPSVSKQIWCTPNRDQVWISVLEGRNVKLASPNCKNPIDQIVALGRKHQISSVPTLIFADGSVMPGYRTAKDIEALLAAKTPK